MYPCRQIMAGVRQAPTPPAGSHHAVYLQRAEEAAGVLHGCEELPDEVPVAWDAGPHGVGGPQAPTAVERSPIAVDRGANSSWADQ